MKYQAENAVSSFSDYNFPQNLNMSHLKDLF